MSGSESLFIVPAPPPSEDEAGSIIPQVVHKQITVNALQYDMNWKKRGRQRRIRGRAAANQDRHHERKLAHPTHQTTEDAGGRGYDGGVGEGMRV